MATYEQIRLWLATAKPREEFIYHTGNGLTATPAVRQIRAAYDRGEVELAQRRVGPGAFAYLAIKRAVLDDGRGVFFGDMRKGGK